MDLSNISDQPGKSLRRFVLAMENGQKVIELELLAFDFPCPKLPLFGVGAGERQLDLS